MAAQRIFAQRRVCVVLVVDITLHAESPRHEREIARGPGAGSQRERASDRRHVHRVYISRWGILARLIHPEWRCDLSASIFADIKIIKNAVNRAGVQRNNLVMTFSRIDNYRVIRELKACIILHAFEAEKQHLYHTLSFEVLREFFLFFEKF